MVIWELGYLWGVCDLSFAWFLESFFYVAVCIHTCVFLWETCLCMCR